MQWPLASFDQTALMRPRGRLRVAFLVDSLQLGGTELNAVRLAERLDRDRIDLHIAHIHPEGPLLARYRAAGLQTASFSFRGFFTGSYGRAVWYFTRYLRHRKIDVLHTHDIYSNVFGIAAARLARVRGLLASRRWWQSELHPLLIRLNVLSSRLAGHVVCNAPSIAAQAATEYGMRPGRVHYIPNFVEADAFEEPDSKERQELRAAMGVPAGAMLLGVVARLAPVKNQILLIRALPAVLAKHPNLFTVFVGDGSEREALNEAVRNLGLSDRVRFPGLLPNRPNIHSCFDVSVLTSTSEASPNALLEAMAAGVPVVATRVGGIPDLVLEGQTGILVPPADPAVLATELAALLDDPQRRKAYGLEGRARALSEFSEGTVIPNLANLYQTLLG